MTGDAGGVELLVEGEDGIHVFRARGLVCSGAHIDQQLGVFDSVALVPGAAAHHEQVSGFRQHQSAALNGAPLGIV